jgi:hypothetical protein
MDIEAKAASCRACGAANKAAAKFCRQCGLPLGADATAHGAEAAAPAEPASPLASRQDVSRTTGDAAPAGGSVPAASADVQGAGRPVAGGMRPSPAVLVAGAFVIAIASVLLFTRSRDKADAPAQAAAPSAPLVAERGSLQVDVNVPARATLDGWHLPDAGAKPASGIVFSDVEATTHTLEVWSEGYRRDTSNVAVRPGQRTKVTVTLQR